MDKPDASPGSWIALALAWLGTFLGDALSGLTLQRLVLAATLVFTILQCIIAVRKIVNLSKTKRAWDAETDRGSL